MPGRRPRHEVLLVDLIADDPEALQDLADLLWRSGFLTRVPADGGDGAADVAVFYEADGPGSPRCRSPDRP